MKRFLVEKESSPPLLVENCAWEIEPDPTRSDTELAVAIRDGHERVLEVLRRAHRRGEGGRIVARSYSNAVDGLLEKLFEHVWKTEEAGEPILAVFAMGGYGREEMAPHSDIDLLFLTGSPPPGDAKSFAARLVRILWDAGFVLGHTVQSVEEIPHIQSADTDFKSALLESRFLFGDRELARRLESSLEEIAASERPTFLQTKIEDTLERQARYGGTYLLLEPNVKSSPGALRDLHTIFWMGVALPWGESLEEWLDRDLLDRDEIDEFLSAYDFLLRVRHEIHFLTRRKRDVLDLVLQREVAERLGYASRGDRPPVEAFMRDYYSHTRFVFQFTQDLFHQVILTEILQDSERGGERPIGKGLYLRGGRLDGDIDSQLLADDPLYVFKIQQAHRHKLSRSLRRRLGKALRDAVTDEAALSSMRRSLFQVFEKGEFLGRILRRIHDLDLLVHLVPEFGELVGLKKHDLYHHYTADEHSIKVLENLDRISSGESGPPEFAKLLKELEDSLPLNLAAWLHDIGKGREGDHCKVGAAMTEKIVLTLGGSKELAGRTALLVRHHLLLSHVSQRRDPRDPSTVDRVAEVVGDADDLTGLYLLTYADMKATSPTVWNEWKGTLLRDLYLRTRAVLEGTAAEQTVRGGRENLLAELGDLGEKAVRHLESLPERYSLLFEAEEVRDHLTMVNELAHAPVVLRSRDLGSWTRVDVCTKDRPAGLSQICGALTVNDLDIHGARVFTREDGVVLDSFLVAPIEATTPLDRPRMNKVRRDLEHVLAGTLDLDGEIARHSSRWIRKFEISIRHPVEVRFEKDPSGEFSIVEVFTHDRPGLLYRLTKTFAALDCDIHLALVSTQANRAIDTFYVKREGRLLSENEEAELKEQLHRELEEKE